MSVLEGTIAPRAKETYDMFRSRIEALPFGVPLPSVAAIRVELGVGQATVEKALDLLESQGFIERKRRKGVFVADRRATGELAIVLNGRLLESGASQAYGLACSRLRQDLHGFNPKWAVKLHLGPGDVPGPELPDTLDLLEPTVLPRLRGVLSFHPLHEMEAKLAAVGVPVVYLGGTGAPLGAGVCMDGKQLLRDGIRHLAEAGCRDVRLLRTRDVGETLSAGTGRIQDAAATAAECGMKFREECIAIEVGRWNERHGYELFMRLWQNTDRPDGVLVNDDILCGGVLRAILQLRVELPRDLRLVTHANRGVELPYHRPVSRLEYDLDEWVDKAVRMLETRVRGLPMEPPVETVRATWVKGETT